MIDGIFYNDIQYFRFYRGGLLLGCLIRADSGEIITGEQIVQWFKRENKEEYLFRGKYTMSGNKISFKARNSLSNSDGRFTDYSGVYQPGKLILDSLNHSTGRRIKGEEFLAVSLR